MFEPQIVRSASGGLRGSTTRSWRSTRAGLNAGYRGAPRGDLRGQGRPRPDLKVTDAVMDDARAWQSRPLDDVYPVVFLDALVLKIRDSGSVQRKACYLAMAINMDGDREVLGMWFQATRARSSGCRCSPTSNNEASKTSDCCVDGLKGFPEAIEAITRRRRCRDASFTSSASTALRPAPAIRRRGQGPQTDLHANNADVAVEALETFEEKWGAQLPVIGQAWRDAGST